MNEWFALMNGQMVVLICFYVLVWMTTLLWFIALSADLVTRWTPDAKIWWQQPQECMLCCHNPQHTSHQIISSIVRSSVCVLKSPLNCIQIASLRGAGYTIALNLRNSLSRLYEHISKWKLVFWSSAWVFFSVFLPVR